MDGKILLKVLGITYSQLQSGAYALILTEVGGLRRIPIVIGASEAQSIAARLEGVALPRPLVHDVFYSAARAFGIAVKEVYIYRFNNGVFFSEITFAEGDREVVIDSRTSDAIALAMRSNTPIYASPEVMESTSYTTNSNEPDCHTEDSITDPTGLSNVPLERFAVEELERMLNQSVEREEYERAAEIKSVIDKKEASNKP